MSQTRKGAAAVSDALCALYENNGYTQYVMSKFEAYDLYVRNKDFLISDSVITFTDLGGRLLALKPDVTLSIVKNSKDIPHYVQKVYYQENVYRISKGTRSFRELPQTGLECMGEIDAYCLFDVIRLACLSLAAISDDYVLDLSHLAPVSALFARLDLPKPSRDAMLKCIGEKNLHELRALCKEAGLDETAAAQLALLASCAGPAGQVLPALRAAFTDAGSRAAFAELETVLSALADAGLGERIRLDFSVISDMKYYNGFVFKGFVRGVPNSVLSGGQYDPLMRRMGRADGAVGFAVYFDEVARLFADDAPFDLDTLLLYDESVPLQTLERTLQQLRADGTQVGAQRSCPDFLRCRRILKLENGEVKTVYEHA
ncbi:MAG: ATP phosphoribosyltransferase regulatory subunit [Clostridia bacterium]|nr:ATP phosphoribosyltransferase regulatory subunit [Clostridia bacterium]